MNTSVHFTMGKTHLFLFLTCLIIAPISNAQHTPGNERGNVNYRAKNQLESNNVRATVFNYGLAGRESGVPITEQTPFEWYKNTGQIYLAVTGLSIGAEVVDENGDTIHIVDLSHYRNSPQGQTWNFEPIPGYFNQSNFQIASSDDPTTWPEFWPDRMNDTTDPGWAGSWDGYFGKNVIIDGQELYFKFSDDLYDKYNYYPDTTDLTRKGLGLIVSGRAFSFNEDFLKDIVFFSYKIKNDGTKPLSKMGISVWWADFVGGDGNDDMLGYDLAKNFIWSYDSDNRSADPSFFEEPVGSISLSLLKFPQENMSLNNIRYLPSSIWVNQLTDEYVWNSFFTPGYFVDTSSITPGDYNAFASTSYFSLQPGETEELMFAVSLANGSFIDPNHSIRRNRITGQYYAALAATQGNFILNDYDVQIITPSNGEIYSDNVSISWTTNGAGNRYVDYLYYSYDNGDHWDFLAVDSSLTGNYNWNTSNIPDGLLYKIKIISVAENGTSTEISDGIFKINKSSVNALPQVYIINPKDNSEINGEYNVSLISGDADNEPVEVALFYKLDKYGEWQMLANNIQNDIYLFNTNLLPNISDFYLKATIKSNSDSASYQVKHITINNIHTVFSDSILMLNSNTPATGILEVRVTNPQELTGDEYVTVFEKTGNTLYYDVINLTTGIKLLDNISEINGNIEGPYFEGLRLFIKNDPLAEIDSLSGWNNQGIFQLGFQVPPPHPLDFSRRADYRLEVGVVGVDTSEYWIYQTIEMLPAPVNFKIFNITENKYISFAFLDRDTSTGKGLLSFVSNSNKDIIFLLESSENDSLLLTYFASLNQGESFRNPAAGDIYSRYITKPFYDGDSVFFSTQNITDIKDVDYLPTEFKLEQNYPNPFNPSTRINFQIPSNAFVQLEVYDILGRKIKTLINKEMNSGTYYADFDGSDFASGVYIYRLRATPMGGQAGNFVSTKKMLMIK